ncbi:hypothetical protein ACOMHN_029052 [Nucella lapillus]
MAPKAAGKASLETNELEEQNGNIDFAASLSGREAGNEVFLLGQWTSLLAVVGAVFVTYYVVYRVVPFTFKVFLMHVVCACCGPLVNLNRFGAWAVVTGCTDGIGKAYAEKLAGMGLNLVLVSRNEEKLQQQARRIGEKTGKLTRIIVADFSQPDIYSRIAIQLAGLDIGMLVNNVGMGMDPEFFLDVPEKLEMMSAMINCNVYSVTMMTAVVLPSMVAKKKGVIINVASAAGLRPLPFLALYSSTKAMVIHLTESLHQEYGKQGILFQAVTPFLVSTKMSRMDEPTGIIIPTPDVFVHHALQVLGVALVTTGYFWHDLQYWLMCWMPDNIVKRTIMTFKGGAEREGKPTIRNHSQRHKSYNV